MTSGKWHGAGQAGNQTAARHSQGKGHRRSRALLVSDSASRPVCQTQDIQSEQRTARQCYTPTTLWHWFGRRGHPCSCIWLGGGIPDNLPQARGLQSTNPTGVTPIERIGLSRPQKLSFSPKLSPPFHIYRIIQHRLRVAPCHNVFHNRVPGPKPCAVPASDAAT